MGGVIPRGIFPGGVFWGGRSNAPTLYRNLAVFPQPAPGRVNPDDSTEPERIHDYAHAQRRKTVLAELKPLYEKEGHIFLYDGYWGEANGVIRAYENGAHGRYLYRIELST